MKQNFVEDNIIILSKQTIDAMLKQEHPSDLIGLYAFYYYTAKWQKTNIIKCSTGYVAKGLNWTKEKVIGSKKGLSQLGLIENEKTKNEKGQITGWYIKLNYLWKKETIRKEIINNQRVASPEGGLDHRVENPDTNALSANSLNALNVNKKDATQKALRENPLLEETHINEIIELFSGVNPTYERLFANKTEREAVRRLVKKFGEDWLTRLLESLPSIISQPYAPRITTPYQLEKKMGELKSFITQQRSIQKTKGKEIFNLLK